MADDATPRRGVAPASAAAPDDADTTFLPRRSAEVWEFQGRDEVVNPRRSSGKDADQQAKVVDSLPSPARIAIPPVPAPAASTGAVAAKFAGLPSDSDAPVVARRSATSPSPWLDDEVKPRRSATSPSEWTAWADSPETPPSFAEIQRRAAEQKKVQVEALTALETKSATPAAAASTAVEPSPGSAAPEIAPTTSGWPAWLRWTLALLVLLIGACVVFFLLP